MLDLGEINKRGFVWSVQTVFDSLFYMDETPRVNIEHIFMMKLTRKFSKNFKSRSAIKRIVYESLGEFKE